MKKLISEKSAPTVAISKPRAGNDGGSVTFWHERAGSFNMVCSLAKKKQYANIKIDGSKSKGNDSNHNNKGNGRGETGKDVSIDDEEADPSELFARVRETSVSPAVATKAKKLTLFEEDEEKLDEVHEEAKHRYILQKKEELLRMDREFDELNRDVMEFIKKEKEEIRYMEGLTREIERRKKASGSGEDEGKGKGFEGQSK